VAVSVNRNPGPLFRGQRLPHTFQRFARTIRALTVSTPLQRIVYATRSIEHLEAEALKAQGYITVMGSANPVVLGEFG